MSEINTLLKKNGLKVTESRKAILKVFKRITYALSYSELDKELKGVLDKVTVYRTLKSFEESGIIHEVMDGSSKTKYALCHDGACSENIHHDAHVHFKCNSCEKTFCLESTQIPTIKLPDGYITNKQFVSFQGECRECA